MAAFSDIDESELDALLEIDDVCSGHLMALAELAALRQMVTHANARLQILRQAMRDTDWQHFCQDYPEADDWFDADGLTAYRIPDASRRDLRHD